MRITGGSHGGRPLKAPKGIHTRPSTDMVRQALFSALFDVEDWRVLDLFAGTGAVGLEALSRGAQHVVFVEKARPALAALQANLDSLKLSGDRTEVQAMPVARALASLRGQSFDLIFADPPYDKAADLMAPVLEVAAAMLTEDGLLICEHRSRDTAPVPPIGLIVTKSKSYGEATLSFYQRQDSSQL